jgi:hypothetical protein
MMPCTEKEKINDIHQDVKEIKAYIFKSSNRLTRIETFLIAVWGVVGLAITIWRVHA